MEWQDKDGTEYRFIQVGGHGIYFYRFRTKGLSMWIAVDLSDRIIEFLEQEDE